MIFNNIIMIIIIIIIIIIVIITTTTTFTITIMISFWSAYSRFNALTLPYVDMKVSLRNT